MFTIGITSGSVPRGSSIFPVSGNSYPTTPTWNPADQINMISFTDGNKQTQMGTTGNNSGARSFAIPRNGKVYFEVEILSAAASNGTPHFGIRRLDDVENVGADATVEGTHYFSHPNGIKDGPTTKASTIGGNGAGVTWQIAIDWDTGKWWLGRENVWVANPPGSPGNPSAGTFSLDDLMPLGDNEWAATVCIHSIWGGNSMRLETALANYQYTPPTGFSDWVGALPPLTYSEEVLLDSPVGYWKLNESAGDLTSMTDSSGNGYDGTFTANHNRSQPPLINTGTSIEFEDSGGVNISGAQAALQLTGDMSAEAWVNLNVFDASNAYIVVCQSIISRPEQASDNFLWSLSVNSLGFVNMFWEYAGGTNVSVTSTHAITVGTDHHLAVVRDTSALTVTFYDNGVEYDTVGYANNPAGGTDSIVQIGKRFGGGEVDGFIDQVAVYNTKLSAARILAHYNSGV